MSPGLALDVALGLVLVLYAVAGYRQGFVVSALSVTGFLGGGALAMWLLPWLLASWHAVSTSPGLRIGVSLAVVFGVAALGQALAVAVGARLRAGVRLQVARWLDSVLGGVALLVTAAVFAWFIAGAVRPSAPAPVARAIGESRLLGVIDGAVPPGTAQAFAGFRSMLDRSGFPRVFEGIEAEPIMPAAPPDPGVVDGPGLRRASASVVKITGFASSCRQGQEGSGWVVADGKIVTNAHVVAGLDDIVLRVRGTGQSHRGRVVLFDPRRDLAVIDAPDVRAAPLPLGAPLARGGSAVVAGFPLDGPYRESPARVRTELTARGADIYGRPGIARDIYSLFATVQPGNSGGPLLDPQGRVVGVVFAKSLDDTNTGYALTLAEARPVIDAAAHAVAPVSTGSCLTG